MNRFKQIIFSLPILFSGGVAADSLDLHGQVACSASYPANSLSYENSCCCGESCMAPPMCGWAYNPPGYCRCNNPADCCNSCDGFGVRLDFLWWRTCATGVALGVEERINTYEIDSTHLGRIDTTHVKKPNFKFDPGFRLGVVNYCACDCWDIALDWTHYHTKARAHGESTRIFTIAAPINNLPTEFLPFWERGTDLIPEYSEGTYTLTMDLLDLECGRKFYVSSCFILRPHFGLRGARFDQSYRVDSYSNNPQVEVTPVGYVYDSTVKAKNDFLAIGPRLGIDLEVLLGCDFALFGNAAGSLVYGRFDRHAKEYYTDYFQEEGPLVKEFEYDAKSSADRCSRAFTDVAIGFKWSRCFDWCGRLHPVSVAFAWEHHAFWNMTNFNFVSNGMEIQASSDDIMDGSAFRTGSRKNGDIYTQGLTVSASFGF